MKILVTGATGFVGQHVVASLLADKHQIIAIGRDPNRLGTMPWRDQVQFVACNIHSTDCRKALAYGGDAIIHLAWPDLPNYQRDFHFERTLPADYAFLKCAIESGIRHVLVAGSGAEFGLRQGALTEDSPTEPVSAYGIAKDSLRRYLQHLQNSHDFILQWVRLFHLYGPGQNPASLLSQLERAVEAKATHFDMSPGDQLRDYLAVEEVARRVGRLVARPDINGVINCCSGTPITVKSLVEQRIAELGATITLNLGVYPYPDYEPKEYWGINGKLTQL